MLLLNPPPTEPPPTFWMSFLVVASESLHIGHAVARLAIARTITSASNTVNRGVHRFMADTPQGQRSLVRLIGAGGGQHPVNDNTGHGNVKPNWERPGRDLPVARPLAADRPGQR